MEIFEGEDFVPASLNHLQLHLLELFLYLILPLSPRLLSCLCLSLKCNTTKMNCDCSDDD